jgi:hypothetical protein
MRNVAAAVGLGATLLAVEGCATARTGVPVMGRTVEITPVHRDDGEDVALLKGELLAVSTERLFVLSSSGVRVVRQEEIDRVRVKLHGFDGRKAGTWTLIGGLVTAGTLAGACSSVESADSCGPVFGVAAAFWGLIGGAATLGLERSSRVFARGADLASLRPYARYPQGFPEGLDPGRLVPAGQGTAGRSPPSARER